MTHETPMSVLQSSWDFQLHVTIKHEKLYGDYGGTCRWHMGRYASHSSSTKAKEATTWPFRLAVYWEHPGMAVEGKVADVHGMGSTIWYAISCS
jgi:hypothetical protein